jgi:hypothetical protein
MADYAFPDLQTVQPSGISTSFQVASTASYTISANFFNITESNFAMPGLTTLERGWNAPGRPQSGQMYPR